MDENKIRTVNDLEWIKYRLSQEELLKDNKYMHIKQIKEGWNKMNDELNNKKESNNRNRQHR